MMNDLERVDYRIQQSIYEEKQKIIKAQERYNRTHKKGLETFIQIEQAEYAINQLKVALDFVKHLRGLK